MYLKALEIQGFKSFPDKTVLQFGEDITAIVGPNGSGKSNISDAIRWVMGEQSAKGLRGAKMEDVIFGGTAKRSAQHFAQVTLVLDNTEHIFPTMEEAEVSVTRRYFRSGESEYYINRQSVRLRDVTELFMDTGMGKEGYSIIGQGKIDEILSTKSGDRREIFEEAAGISKFRHRKEESERKLQRTEENLVRINDKISELELQVEPLRQQAEKAKKYLVLRDELRLLEISLWLENLDGLKAEERKLQSDFSEAQRSRDEAKAASEALYAKTEAVGETIRQTEVAAEELRAASSLQEGQKKEEEAAVAVLHTTIAHQEENIRRGEEELSHAGERTEGFLAQALEQEQEQAALEAERAKREEELEALLERSRTAAQEGDDAQSALEGLRAQEAVALAAAAEAKAQKAAAQGQCQQLRERQETAQRDMEEAEQRRTAARTSAREQKKALEEARENAAAAANVIAGYSLRLEEREKKAAAATEARMKQQVDVNTLDRRIELLSAMEKDLEGFTKSVKLVCGNPNLRGIRGPVASLMQTPGEYSLAIEIALGAGLQNIVVDREEDAKAAIQYLKQRDGGRATFLPLTAIRGDELRLNGVEQEYGFVGLASRLVRFDPQYRTIFQNLLGRTVIAEDMDCGIAMARKYQNAFRIVTLDGQVINRGGSMTGGSTNRSAGILSRSAELTALRGKAEGMHQSLQKAKATEETLLREVAVVRYEIETAEAQRTEAEKEVLRLEGEKKHYDALLTSLAQSLDDLEGELTSIAGRIQENEAQADQAQADQAAQEQEAQRCREQEEALLAGQEELRSKSSFLAEAISEKKEAIATLTAQADSAGKRCADLRELAQALSGDRSEKEAALQSYRTQIAEAQGEIDRHLETIAAMDGVLERQRRELEALTAEKLRLEGERTAFYRSGQEKNELYNNLYQAVSRLEQKIAAASMEEKQILDRLWEHYELSHSDAQAQRMELESLPKARSRIGELKRSISALGTPNIGAIEEFDRVNTRYTYLSDQRNDVEKAKRDLEAIIGEITGQMTEIFSQQFKLLSESFETTFTELFGGGTARLELEDESDILGCGIEIKAQPPGKTLKTISLLSGGEKAFVAIALYFSILKVHPTPFCVMDEIEAALDDVNVTRYARYMRTLAGKTQFIVITHRRGTMEEADVLYGVTMQEQGISKILTINLNDMAKELNID